jgi:hypothetical protein
MIDLMILALIALTTYLAHRRTRQFVGERLRFVDAVQRRIAPWLAGAGTTLVALPLVAMIPGVGVGTAVLLGGAVGLGVARGAKDARQSTGYELRPISGQY